MTMSKEAHKRAIGRKLSVMRLARGWSQSHVANAIGCTPRAVAYWEDGERMTQPENLWQLCQLYGVTFEWLVGDVFGAPSGERRSA